MTSSVTAPLERQFGQMPGPQADDVDQLRRRVGHHAAVRPRPRARRRRAAGAGRDQRRRAPSCPATCPTRRSTARSIRPTRRSSRWRSPPTRCRSPRCRTWPTPAWRRRSRSSPASAWSASAAARSRPSASRPIRRALAAYGLDPRGRAHRRSASANVEPGQGQPRRAARRPSPSTPTTSSRRAAEYRNLVVAYRNGAPVRLSDVADVGRRRGERAAGRLDERQARGDRQHPAPARRQRHRGGRPHQAAAAAAAGRRCPRSVEVAILTDRTTTIRASVHDVQFELMLTVVLVVLVIFLFLRSLAGHRHPERRGAALARRHLRRSCTCSASA